MATGQKVSVPKMLGTPVFNGATHQIRTDDLSITNPMSGVKSYAYFSEIPCVYNDLASLTVYDITRDNRAVATDWQLAYGVHGTA